MRTDRQTDRFAFTAADTQFSKLRIVQQIDEENGHRCRMGLRKAIFYRTGFPEFSFIYLFIRIRTQNRKHWDFSARQESFTESKKKKQERFRNIHSACRGKNYQESQREKITRNPTPGKIATMFIVFTMMCLNTVGARC